MVLIVFRNEDLLITELSLLQKEYMMLRLIELEEPFLPGPPRRKLFFGRNRVDYISAADPLYRAGNFPPGIRSVQLLRVRGKTSKNFLTVIDNGLQGLCDSLAFQFFQQHPASLSFLIRVFLKINDALIILLAAENKRYKYFFSASALSVFSQDRSRSVRPKWP